MYGLGEREHNRKVREERENRRPERKCVGDIKLWRVWEKTAAEKSETGNVHSSIRETRGIPADIIKKRKEELIHEITQNIKKQN